MIKIKKSPTADTRTCDFKSVTKETLEASSRQHIGDVASALFFFADKLRSAALVHDEDKIADIDCFHSDFTTGFVAQGWWDNHRKITRHHLSHMDGVPEDVNLLDVLEYISDCVMAGMARTGEVYQLVLPSSVILLAFNNTVELLKKEVEVDNGQS